MTSLTIDDRVLPSSGLDLEVLLEARAAGRATMQRETVAPSDLQAQKLAAQNDKGQWRILRYL